MGNLEKAYELDISIREADENLPPNGIAVQADEFDKDGVVYEKDGVKVIAFEVDHGVKIKPAYGYRIEYNGRAAVISGDTRYSQNVIRYGTGADLLIHEVAIARPELMSAPFAQAIIAHHTSPHDAGRVFAQAKPKLAAYTHLVFLSNEKVAQATLEDSLTDSSR
jgi:ribonuclease Z